jgi:transcriptional regulator with XRE-family HTH domain
MPASAPVIDAQLAAHLAAIGEQLRAHRKQLKLTAVTAAEAAGMSRVTWHRIERGEPSVTMGAYMAAAAALGLALQVIDPQLPTADAASAEPDWPNGIRIDEYPQLKRLAWHQPGTAVITPQEALSLYERNWRHADPLRLEPKERALIQALLAAHGRGRMLV